MWPSRSGGFSPFVQQMAMKSWFFFRNQYAPCASVTYHLPTNPTSWLLLPRLGPNGHVWWCDRQFSRHFFLNVSGRFRWHLFRTQPATMHSDQSWCMICFKKNNASEYMGIWSVNEKYHVYIYAKIDAFIFHYYIFKQKCVCNSTSHPSFPTQPKTTIYRCTYTSINLIGWELYKTKGQGLASYMFNGTVETSNKLPENCCIGTSLLFCLSCMRNLQQKLNWKYGIQIEREANEKICL